MIALEQAKSVERTAAKPSDVTPVVRVGAPHSSDRPEAAAPAEPLHHHETAVASPAHAQALMMAALGYPVFALHGIVDGKCTCSDAACKSPGKHPRRPNSYKDATTDTAIINMWFKYEPNLNYGVRLGQEVGTTGKMVIVVDVDSYKVGGAEALDELERLHGRLPETVEVLTGAGGSHRYFLTDCSISFVGKIGENIDLKVNGYVVGPGSMHASGRRYEMEASSDLFAGCGMAELPQWVIARFSKSANLAQERDEAPPSVAPLTTDERTDIELDLAVISAACSRDQWLKVLMGLHSRNQSKEMLDIAHKWSQTCPEKYDARAVEKAWDSFTTGGGITYKTVFAMAEAERNTAVYTTKLLESFKNPRSEAPPDCNPSAAITMSDDVPMPPAAASRFKVHGANEMLAMPPIAWIVRGLIPRRGVAALYGASGSGKSFLTLALAKAIAGGDEDFYGMKIYPCPVTYCVLEGEGGMSNRVRAWQEYTGESLPDQLRFVTQPLQLTKEADINELATAIVSAGGGGGIVIIDTLSQATAGCDENSSADMGEIIKASKALAVAIDGVTLLVHHTGKDAGKGARGHSSFFAALDGAIGVGAAHKDQPPFWTVAKSKDGVTGAMHSFILETVVVGTDDDGSEIESCVALPAAPPLAHSKPTTLGKHQKAGLSAMRNVPSPFGPRQLTHERAIEIVGNAIVVPPKRKKERAKAALASLAELGHVQEVEGGYIVPD